MPRLALGCCLLVLLWAKPGSDLLMAADAPLVIAHRGASGYLPEHTLPAKAMAHAMGADYLEQDVVLTRDGVPIVLHDIHLEPTTDVEQVFPGRVREDGRFYAIDFDLAEIRRLRVHERSRRATDGREEAVFSGRFPLQPTSLQVPTLAEEIALIDGMNRSSGRRAGLYIELKAPRFHRRAGQDIARAVLQVLRDTGYSERTEQVYLQCFDDATLRYLRSELQTPLPLIQLIADEAWGEDSAVDYDYLRSAAGLDEVATYADGIGPWIMHIYLGRDATGAARLSDLVNLAHARNLLVHPFTLRSDQLPEGVEDLDTLHHILLDQAGVDGAFTDFPDRMRAYIDRERAP